MAWLTKSFLFSLVFLFLSTAYCDRPEFKTHKLEIKNVVLRVEVADSPKQTAYGLMKIDKLPKGYDGMLFVFPQREELSFWIL